ncbi:MAG: hypothetical protein OXH23_03435 [bacterium]|nr:hypothetical protein [bacterium]
MRVVVSLLAILSLLATACGNDDDSASYPPTTESTVDHSEDTAMEGADDGHDHAHDHDHDHATLMEVDYEPVPTIELRTHLDPASGVNLEIITTGFTLAPERASTDPIDGEGHFHIYVDGVKLRRLYAHWAHVDLKEPGDYEIRVELSANNHATLAVNGVKLDATAVVTIPGAAEDPEPVEMDDSAGITIEVEVAGSKPVDGVQRHRIDAGDDVTIIVTGDTTDELHVHGYDIVVPFAPGQPGTITFEANIPGIFEVESHHHGDLVMELQVG